ncbi:MAG TPA: FeoA family protein [Steroidobacteraceae bacterium]|nr:FeoA family protein [Steroidobacteraceae bacterium]
MTSESKPVAGPPVPLSQLHRGARGTVHSVVASDDARMGDIQGSTVSRRLAEIGFVAGESCEVVEEVWPGGDPMAVRIGGSLFALRRREARDVLVALLAP